MGCKESNQTKPIATKVVIFSSAEMFKKPLANSVDPDQAASLGAICSGCTLFASILNLSVMLGNYLQQTTSADAITRQHFQMHFFLGALRVKGFLHSSVFRYICCFPFYTATIPYPRSSTETRDQQTEHTDESTE